MKEKDLREVAKCVKCGKGFGASGLPTFYRVRIQRYGIDMKAIKRQTGLEMMMGGHIALAQVMGPDEDMAEKISEKEITLCESCAYDQYVIPVFLED